MTYSDLINKYLNKSSKFKQIYTLYNNAFMLEMGTNVLSAIEKLPPEQKNPIITQLKQAPKDFLKIFGNQIIDNNSLQNEFIRLFKETSGKILNELAKIIEPDDKQFFLDYCKNNQIIIYPLPENLKTKVDFSQIKNIK